MLWLWIYFKIWQLSPWRVQTKSKTPSGCHHRYPMGKTTGKKQTNKKKCLWQCFLNLSLYSFYLQGVTFSSCKSWEGKLWNGHSEGCESWSIHQASFTKQVRQLYAFLFIFSYKLCRKTFKSISEKMERWSIHYLMIGLTCLVCR